MTNYIQRDIELFLSMAEINFMDFQGANKNSGHNSSKLCSEIQQKLNGQEIARERVGLFLRSDRERGWRKIYFRFSRLSKNV